MHSKVRKEKKGITFGLCYIPSPEKIINNEKMRQI